MLKMTLSIDKLPVNQSTPIMVRIINTGPGICTSINLMLDIPPSMLIVDGDPHVRIARLEANEWHEHSLKIKASQQGTFCIQSTNYSYTDARLRGCHPSEPLTAALEIIAAPQVVTPVQNSSRPSNEMPKEKVHSSPSASTRRRILILTVNPFGVPQLRLDQEVRDIKEALKRAKLRHQFNVENATAVRTSDFRRVMLEYRPNLVHFSGHGNHDGLFFEDESGYPKLVTAEAVAGLFKLFAQVECVLLNACYSVLQAEAISQHVKYVIGMRNQISDTASIEFSTGFYDALGVGSSIEYAFEIGKASISLGNVAEHLLPILRVRGARM